MKSYKDLLSIAYRVHENARTPDGKRFSGMVYCRLSEVEKRLQNSVGILRSYAIFLIQAINKERQARKI